MAREIDVPGWKHLVRRPQHWKKQLYLRGRNITVLQVVGPLIVNRRTHQEQAADMELPVEAVLEALAYYRDNQAIINEDVLEEKRRLAHE